MRLLTNSRVDLIRSRAPRVIGRDILAWTPSWSCHEVSLKTHSEASFCLSLQLQLWRIARDLDSKKVGAPVHVARAACMECVALTTGAC